jgi:hypothetical protein
MLHSFGSLAVPWKDATINHIMVRNLPPHGALENIVHYGFVLNQTGWTVQLVKAVEYALAMVRLQV